MSKICFAGGDRDCSSAVISAYQAAGLDVNATYTGNMLDGFLATGKFEMWDTGSTTAQRGDIYLNYSDHTAMCVDDGTGAYGYDALAEFSINEFGGITGGQVGDQTGSESSIHGYYDFPWNCTLHCIDRELADRAAAVMEHLCTCPNHGYTQGGGRWGDGTTECVEYGSSDVRSAGVQLYEGNATDAQRWAVSWDADGWATLTSVSCGLALDVSGGGSESGTPVQVYTPNGTDAQKWKVEEYGGGYNPVAPVYIYPKCAPALRLDAQGGGTSDGTPIQVYDANGTDAQKWQVADHGDGTWSILDIHASKFLDVVNGGN